MPAGRPPVPTALKVLRGNPGRRPLNADEPQPMHGLPSCPKHLSEEGKKAWHTAGKMLEDSGIMTRLDGPALALLCETYARYLEANDAARRTLLVKVNGIPTPNPCIAIANKAADQLRRLFIEFGMTPASRSRLSIAKRSDASDKFKRFFGDRQH